MMLAAVYFTAAFVIVLASLSDALTEITILGTLFSQARASAIK